MAVTSMIFCVQSNLLTVTSHYHHNENSVAAIANCHFKNMNSLLRKSLSRVGITRCRFTPSPSRVCLSTFSADDDTETDEAHQKVALVLGSSGCLGSTVVKYFGESLNMKVVGADVVGLSEEDARAGLDTFIKLPTYDQPAAVADVMESLIKGIGGALENGEALDVIICVSGGFASDPKLPKPDISDDDFVAGAKEYGATINNMLEMNLYPVLAAGYAANRFMADEGLFVAMGATPALSATPGMLAYGLSKVGTHHYVQTLGEMTGKAMTTRTKRQKARRLRKDNQYLDTLSVIGILPTTIDTPNNRKTMPEANFEDWVKPIDIATELGNWTKTPELRPHSGSLIKVYPAKAGGAVFTLAR